MQNTTQILTLNNIEIDEDGRTAVRFTCNFNVVCTGDGIWGCEAGRIVNVRGINVFVEDGYTMVNVEHDSTWNIYTDNGFSEAISKAVGLNVDFTEQGMQEDGFASMEV